MIIRLIGIFIVCIFASGCASTSLKVTTPVVKPPNKTVGYVKIESIKDIRAFTVAPNNPALPSIEGDHINDKKITDKAVGRMRHGMFHNALWNYSLKGNEDIYSVCERIVANSFTEAGYRVVNKGAAEYETAVPISIEIVQFWEWMQPKFNIDLNFDGELVVKSNDKRFTVDAKGSNLVSTAFAGESAWTDTMNVGVKRLQENLTGQLKNTEK